MTSSIRHLLTHNLAGQHWITAARRNLVPWQWRNWLCDRGSLTLRLTRASHNHFSVRLLEQGWGRPSASESCVLGMSGRQVALIREVELLGQGEPWVYARSVIPEETLTGRHRQLRHLGATSLGAVLFKDPDMRRGPLQVCRLHSPELGELWARRSLFYLSEKPLLVCEVFLPALQRVQYPL
ncbi:chorismate--pyruvate lyase family protein [Nitrincola sp. MINF-07-Sa-05]|uniref:chorismate--pyruvate lyase family protein n=1 Tax=Nitrincola salilacus TaxID=3400273 RepID=UPI0039183DE1